VQHRNSDSLNCQGLLMSASSKQIFRDSDEDKGYRSGPGDPLPVNTVAHRIMGSLLGMTFFLGGIDLAFRLFHLFSSSARKSTSYDLSIGIFFTALGIGLMIYAIQAAKAARKSLIPIIIAAGFVVLVFFLPMILQAVY
jgi:hypothetical protein